jgi:hypothetical protein
MWDAGPPRFVADCVRSNEGPVKVPLRLAALDLDRTLAERVAFIYEATLMEDRRAAHCYEHARRVGFESPAPQRPVAWWTSISVGAGILTQLF